MSTHGQRKTALYLSALRPADRQRLLASLGPTHARPLESLVEALQRRGWARLSLVNRVLAEDLGEAPSADALEIDALLMLVGQLPPEWGARVLAANGGTDPEFLLALLHDGTAAALRQHLNHAPALPPALREAVLIQARHVALGADA